MFCLQFPINCQIVYHQDVFKGGVTGDGYNPYTSETPGTLDVYIETGSSIRKAYLFISISTRDSILDNSFNSFFFDSTEIFLSENLSVNNSYKLDPLGPEIITFNTIVLDVTNLVNPTVNSYLITPPKNQNTSNYNAIYSDYYLYVEYENTSMSTINSFVMLNNQDADAYVEYNFVNLNIIDTFESVGFTFNSQSFCDTLAIQDGSYVYLNSNLLGLVGGNESTLEPLCAGVRGSFYYQNMNFFGLDNDISNSLMSGVDVISDIKPYIFSTDSFTVSFLYQSTFSPKSNPLNQLFLTYTTPCDTFSVTTPNDTTVCYGTQLQLNVTGGQKYEWLPSTGLSCDTCANPIFTADSSMNYTVRVWNNDSCSVVRPLQLLVSHPRIKNILATPPDCGASNGQLALDTDAFSWLPTSYSINNGALQVDSIFNNLSEGSYLLHVEDSLGCFVDSVYFLEAVNNTVANFATTAGAVEVPVTVWGENQSQYASSYSWWVDGVFFSTNTDILPVFTTTGTHTIELIAWQYDPLCADTVAHEIVIQHQVIVPSAFTPDGDNINDVWELPHLDELYPNNQVKIFNRWGSLVYSSKEGDYSSHPWDATYNGQKVATGTYFYIIDTQKEQSFKGSLTVMY